MADDQPGFGQGALVELFDRGLDAVHCLDNVGAGLANGVDGERGLAEEADGCPGFLVCVSDVRDIADRDPAYASGGFVGIAGQHHLLDLSDGLELALGAYRIAALALVHLSGRDGGICGA